jgi:hypothetical protein
MIALALSMICGSPPTREECALIHQREAVVCSSEETVDISDFDPGLILFWQWQEGESLDSAKEQLAEERVSLCDLPKPRRRP